MSARSRLWGVLGMGIGMVLSGCGGGGGSPPPPTPPVITTTSLPAAVEGSAYTQTIQATGTAPLSFSLSGGTLPAGLSLASTGVISGTPTGPTGPSNFTIKVTDGNNPALSSTQPLSIAVDAAPTLTITTTSLTNGYMNMAYSATLQTTGGVAPITWTLMGGAFPTGMGLNANGTISGTPTVSGVFSVTLRAADSSLPQQTDTKTLGLTVNPTLLITTTRLLNPMAGEAYNQTVHFTGGTGTVTWSLASGTLPAGLTLDPSTGAITGTPPVAAVGLANFTVHSMDSSQPTPQTATQPLSLTVTTATDCGSGSESLLKGPYAMSMTGFDASGPVGMLASFTADGAGNITAGVEDINSTGLGGVQTNVPVTTASSSYAIGSDHRGCLTLVAGGVTREFRFSVGLIQAGVADGARVIEFDPPGTNNTATNTAGTIRIQNPLDFSNAAFNGSYVFRANSPITVAGGGLSAAVGALNLDGVSAVTGSGDFNANGVVSSTIAFTPGTYSIGPNGRGTLSFTPSGGPTINLIVYVLFANQLLAMSSDAQSVNTLFSCDIQKQTVTSPTDSTLSAPILIYATGQTGTGVGSASRVEAGVFTPDGVGNFTFSGDQNGGGTPSSPTAMGTYGVAANGRVQVTNTGDATPTFLLYLITQNMAFIMSTDTHVMAGYSELQQGGAPFTNASFIANGAGPYSLATTWPVVAPNALVAGVATYDGAGNVNGTFDINESGFVSLGNVFTATYSASANGRVVTPASGTTQRLTYIIFPGKVVTFDDSSGDTNPGLVISQQ
jgi:large repetitive protein